MAKTFNDIKVGDIVEFRTPQQQLRRGRAVMRGQYLGSWVLNCGGMHGTPAVVFYDHFVRIVRSRSSKAKGALS